MTTLYNQDFYEIVKDFQANNLKVNHIITDIPYNISKQNNFTTMGRQGIDFGEWDKGFDDISWLSLATPLIDEGGLLLYFVVIDN